MAVITIDGIKLDVPENKNVLDCALENGIYIPHLCHHKDLSPLGSCRMCVVEVEGQEGVTTTGTKSPGPTSAKGSTGKPFRAKARQSRSTG